VGEVGGVVGGVECLSGLLLFENTFFSPDIYQGMEISLLWNTGSGSGIDQVLCLGT
jgi:hypothetical protein